MPDSQKWWDEFWANRASPRPSVRNTHETWDDLVWKANYEYWEDVFETHAPGRSMLECGCGSGKISRHFAQKGYRCTLLDYSRQGIAVAKNHFRELSLKGTFVIGDIRRLCFPDGKFDMVFSGGVLEFFPDAEHAIREMVRVLKPGGVFAANMVPDKFSIQTIADLERTVACSAKNLFRGRFREVFKMVRHIPPSYNVQRVPLGEYVRFCENAGLTSVHGAVTSPFPELSLPGFGKEYYSRMMKRLVPQWKRFNQSNSRWTEIWGIVFSIYGIKK